MKPDPERDPTYLYDNPADFTWKKGDMPLLWVILFYVLIGYIFR